MGGGFTFAVIGHNEAERLHVALGQALEAAAPGDRVWFVDSGSTDDSAERAAALGAEVIAAPLGKGRAIAVALARCDSTFICFVDGDMESSDCNVPAALRDTAVATDADMVVGSFTEALRRRSVTPGMYMPLMGALFPEVLATGIEIPLSGLRALRPELPLGRIPPEYGVETHLNVHVTLAGCRIANCRLGAFVGPVRDYANLVPVALDVAQVILDEAEARGRITPAQRPAWDGWVTRVITVMQQQPTGADDERAYLERLMAAAARPFPSRKNQG